MVAEFGYFTVYRFVNKSIKGNITIYVFQAHKIFAKLLVMFAMGQDVGFGRMLKKVICIFTIRYTLQIYCLNV